MESEPLDHQGSPERVVFFFFFGEEHILKLTLVKSAQLCKYAKNHGIIQITWMDCIVCEFYLNSLLKYVCVCVCVYKTMLLEKKMR